MATPKPIAPLAHPDGVSARSLRIMKGPLSYIGRLFQALGEGLWSQSNREGWIPLVVAENKLSGAAMLERLEAAHGFPPEVLNYANMKGLPQLQTALARLMEHTFLKGVKLDPSLMILQSGCTAILDHLFFAICDVGEGVLIPAPYYPAFDNDLRAKNYCEPLPFHLDLSPAAVPVAEQLDAAAAAAAERGITVRGLLLTNPNNPDGTIYSDDTLLAMMRWCLQRQVHLISDEIYALSVYKPAQFTSALTLVERLLAENGTSFSRNDTDRLVHLIYGLSKDWCGSGLRVGVLYTRNAKLQQAFGSLSGFGSVSNYAQLAIAQALSDLEWADGFIKQNQRALETSYDTLAEGLQATGIPFVPAVAGMFVWIDLRAWLPEQSWEGERKLWDSICDTSRVVLTPGFDCHSKEPGFFRLCFAWVQREALAEAMQRLQKQLTPAGAAAQS